MSFFISKVAPRPLQDLQSDMSNPHDNVNTLGKPKWGFSRMGFSLPFYTKNQSWTPNNQLSQQAIQQKTAGPTHQPPIKTSVLGQTEWHKQVSIAEIEKLAHAQESNLATFKATDFIKNTVNRVLAPEEHRPSYEDNEQWARFSNIARTPIAQEFFQKHRISLDKLDTLQTLSQIHHHFNVQSGRSRTLYDLIHEAKQASNQNSIPHLALLNCVETLSNVNIPNSPEKKNMGHQCIQKRTLRPRGQQRLHAN